MLNELQRPLAVACHDAGGTNQIISLLHELCLQVETVYVDGPAQVLWDKAFPDTQRVNNSELLLKQAKTLLTGTGWASDLEHNARKGAKERGIYSIAVLDHWTNYRERFVRHGEMVISDELWVVDEYAKDLAQRLFPAQRIKSVPDYYAQSQLRKIQPLAQSTAHELLYLCEPIRTDWGRDETGEFQSLRYFFTQLPHMQIPLGTVIRLRPHPSEAQNKYNTIVAEFPEQRVIVDEGDLAHSLSRARWVVGCQTYAMTLALKAGRLVYCSLPPWAPSCKLPHREIIHLKNLTAVS
jgi:hypothetical protein